MVANKFLCDFFSPPRSCSPLNLSPTGSPGRKSPYPGAHGPQLLSTQPHVPVASRPGPPGAGATGRAAGPRGLDRLLSLCAPFVCSEVTSHPGTRTHCLAISHLLAQASSLCPRQMGPSFFCFGRRAGQGLQNACVERKWQGDEASHWASQHGCERLLGSGPRPAAGTLGRARVRRRGPYRNPKEGENGMGARLAFFCAVVPVLGTSVPLKVE